MTSTWSNILFIAMVAATLYSSIAQTTHVVGGTSGWSFPSSGAIAYTNWASQQTFTLGDILEFNFATGSHNVAEVSRTAFDACNTTQTPISVVNTGPANITLNSTGAHYYICAFTGHCDAGMKLAINVSSPATNTTTPPPPASSPAPVPSPSRTPPPRSTTPSAPAQSPSRTPTPSTTPSTPAPSPSRTPAPSTTPSTPAPSPSRTSRSYTVGDALGWTFPSGNLTSYAVWASNKTFFVGDTLVFNFTNGRHNVAELTSQADFDSCNTSATTNLIATSPASITLTTSGEHFYICTFPTHCVSGMKLAVNVSSSTTTNSPPSSSTTPPPPSSSTTPTPPSPSSASKFVVASAMPITLLSIAFALFF